MTQFDFQPFLASMIKFIFPDCSLIEEPPDYERLIYVCAVVS
jgi:hypothetical protein